MGYLDGFNDPVQADGQAQAARHHAVPEGEGARKPIRLHGRHVLNRYEDGMEKCIGCELCAGVCPARCIYVRGADNPPDDPVSPGERYGFIYEINYLRCIHCDLCVEACPTEAITETKLFEFSFTNRARRDLHQGRAARRRRRPAPAAARGRTGARARTSTPRPGCGPPRPSGDAAFEGRVAWSGELGYGVRDPEAGQAERRRRRPTPSPSAGQTGDVRRTRTTPDHGGH